MMTRTIRLLPVVSLFLLAAGSGCATRERTPDAILSDGALAYHMGVYLEGADTASPARTDTPGTAVRGGEPVSFRRSERDLLVELLLALEAPPDLFSKVSPIPASSRNQALEVAREKDADVLLVLGFRAPREFEDYERPLGWASLEVVCWLFGGVPSWFVPTVHYETRAHLSVEGIELASPTSRLTFPSEEGPSEEGSDSEPQGPGLTPADWREAVEAPRENVSLWDRSHPFDRPLDYVTTIFIPPMVLARGDPERLSEELTLDVIDDLGESLRATLRERLLKEEVRGLLSAVFVSPETGSTVESSSVSPRIALSNRGGGRIVALEVTTISNGGEPFQWEASPAELEELSSKIRARSTTVEYVLYDLPVSLPLKPGENEVKLRVRRDDDELLTRTAVFFR